MSEAWRAIAALLGDLLRLRRGPQDVPHSKALLLLALLPYAALSSVLAAFAMPAPKAVLYGPTEAALLALLVYGALALRRRPARYLQTLTALLLVGLVFNLLSLPLTALAQPENGLALLILLLVAWSFAVSVHILRLALDIPVPGSVLVNLGFFFAAYFGLGYLFGLVT
jgi:hypothetical protein